MEYFWLYLKSTFYLVYFQLSKQVELQETELHESIHPELLQDYMPIIV